MADAKVERSYGDWLKGLRETHGDIVGDAIHFAIREWYLAHKRGEPAVESSSLVGAIEQDAHAAGLPLYAQERKEFNETANTNWETTLNDEQKRPQALLEYASSSNVWPPESGVEPEVAKDALTRWSTSLPFRTQLPAEAEEAVSLYTQDKIARFSAYMNKRGPAERLKPPKNLELAECYLQQESVVAARLLHASTGKLKPNKKRKIAELLCSLTAPAVAIPAK